MKVIYKHKLNFDEDGQKTVLHLRETSRVILFGRDGRHNMCLWLEEDMSDISTIPRDFIIAGTGQEYDAGYHQLQSFIDGPYVWHLLERKL